MSIGCLGYVGNLWEVQVGKKKFDKNILFNI